METDKRTLGYARAICRCIVSLGSSVICEYLVVASVEGFVKHILYTYC